MATFGNAINKFIESRGVKNVTAINAAIVILCCKMELKSVVK